MKQIAQLIAIIFIFTSCSQIKEPQVSDPLPSWNEGASKNAIIDFVNTTTDPNSKNFIPVADRITVFDNDGTLWSERPLYFQFEFAMDMVRLHAVDHPEWKEEQPFKGILENDPAAVMASGEEGIGKLLVTTHTGMSNTDFKQTVANWIDTAHHNQTGKLYKEMIFQPMLEVLEYLRANDFKTYIVSGGSVNFMQPWAPEAYGIAVEQIIGTRFKGSFQMNEDGPVIMREPSLEFFNDKGGKPVNISQIIGKIPVAAFGNSDGDLAMLQYTSSNKRKSLMVYIHHTDAKREFAYDRKSHVGKLDKGLDEAAAKGWTVVDMKKDWKTIYPE